MAPTFVLRGGKIRRQERAGGAEDRECDLFQLQRSRQDINKFGLGEILAYVVDE